MTKGKIKKLYFSTLSFVNQYKVTIVIIALLFLIAALNSVELIILNVSEEQILSLIEIIIGSLSSIFGIIVAIYILAFSLFEKNYAKLAYKKFMNNPALHNYIQLIIMTIIVFIFVNILLIDGISNYCLNITGFGLLLYIVSLILIYPNIKKLIHESKSDRHIIELLENIDIKVAMQYMEADSNEEISKNPFFELAGLSKVLIENDERTILNNILNNTSKKIITSINFNTEEETREYIKAFLIIYRAMISYAIKINAVWLPRNILHQYYTIKKYAVKKDKSTYIFFEFDRFVDEIIDELLKLDSREIIDGHVRFIFDFIKYNIEHNLPDETEILRIASKEEISTKKKIDYKIQAKWDLIHSGCIFNIKRIESHIVDQRKDNICTTLVFQYDWLIGYVLESELLGDRQKRALLLYYNYSFKQYLLSLIARGGGGNLFSVYSPFHFDKIIEFDEDVFLQFYNSYEKIVIELFKTNQMDTYKLNEFAAVGRVIVEKIETKESTKVVIRRMIIFFRKLAELYNSKMNYDDLLMYKEIYSQAKTIIRWVNNKYPDSEFSEELAYIISDLDDVEVIDEALNDLNSFYNSIVMSLRNH